MGDDVFIDQVDIHDMDYSGKSGKIWEIHKSRLVRCLFRNLKVDDFCFGSGNGMSEFVDCSFDGSKIKALNPGKVRFVRCSFRNVRLTKWICTEAEFIDCVFTGTLKEINFNAHLSEFGQKKLGRVFNRYEGNDFTGAKLSGVAFMGGVNLLDQKLPEGDGHLFLEEAEPVLVAALSRVDSWPESPENKAVRSHLELKLESYVLRGQRQLLISPHDFTSRDGVKERTFARLTEVLTSVLAYRAAADPSDVADEDTRLRTMRRAARGHPFTYFRAADADAATRAVDHPNGPAGQPALDAVDGAGIEPFLVLGELLALIRDSRWHPDIVPYISVWPPAADEPQTAEEYEQLPEDSPWKTSHTSLQELGVEVRDTLAAVDDDRLTDIATAWARTDTLSQFSDTTPRTVHALVTDFVTLARRARDTNTWLYCWSDSNQRRLG